MEWMIRPAFKGAREFATRVLDVLLDGVDQSRLTEAELRSLESKINDALRAHFFKATVTCRVESGWVFMSCLQLPQIRPAPSSSSV